MNPGISKSRVRRVVRLRRQQRAKHGPPTSFRNGLSLALAYVAGAIVAALLLSFSVKGSLGAVGGHGGLLPTALANAGVLCAAALCGRLLLGQLAPECVSRNSRVLMLCLVAVAADVLCVGSAVFGPALFYDALPVRWGPGLTAPFGPLAGFLLPHLFAPVLATLLAGAGAGVALGVALAVQSVLFVPPEAGLATVLLGVLAGIAAPVAVSGVRRRGPLVRVMLLLGLFQFAALASAACAVPDLVHTVFYRIGEAEAGQRVVLALAILSGTVLLVAPAAVLLLLSPLEHVFAACSDIRLDLFSDLAHPLLKRLALEAPGTYHHSLVVANLASAAAEAVGANPLLALVGGYYHDVGKLSAPGKFTENLALGETNPHDALPPHMSALVLSAHVKDGIALALDYRLPVPIRDIIEEHHGSSLMAFFLDKARKQAEAKAAASGAEPEPVDENLFRYTGRRPTSAEAAIVSLADSVEAASRSLPSVTPAQLEKLVDSIVAAKSRDGQLDLCPLTFPDIVEIRRSFAATLATSLHGRIAYPKEPEEEKETAAAPAAPAPAEAPAEK